MSEKSFTGRVDRRKFLGICSVAGLGQTLLPGVLFGMAQVQSPLATGSRELGKITPEMIDAAAVIAGITVTDEQKKMMLEGLKEQRDSVTVIRSMHLTNSLAPAFVFDPAPPGMVLDTARRAMKMSAVPDVSSLISGGDALAFATVRQLAELIKKRKVTSLTLTKMYLARLKKYDPRLHFVITLTEERALASAAAADAEIEAGKYRGPLHGIPWGAKDLLAVKGYRTTWGAAGFEEQQFDY
ncbi:MAG: amidase family protein, partial [Edaphobacter sp.]